MDRIGVGGDIIAARNRSLADPYRNLRVTQRFREMRDHCDLALVGEMAGEMDQKSPDQGLIQPGLAGQHHRLHGVELVECADIVSAGRFRGAGIQPLIRRVQALAGKLAEERVGEFRCGFIVAVGTWLIPQRFRRAAEPVVGLCQAQRTIGCLAQDIEVRISGLRIVELPQRQPPREERLILQRVARQAYARFDDLVGDLLFAGFHGRVGILPPLCPPVIRADNQRRIGRHGEQQLRRLIGAVGPAHRLHLVVNETPISGGGWYGRSCRAYRSRRSRGLCRQCRHQLWRQRHFHEHSEPRVGLSSFGVGLHRDHPADGRGLVSALTSPPHIIQEQAVQPPFMIRSRQHTAKPLQKTGLKR